MCVREERLYRNRAACLWGMFEQYIRNLLFWIMGAYMCTGCISECIAFWMQWKCTNGRTLELKCAECCWSADKSGFQSCLETLLSALHYFCSLLFSSKHFFHCSLSLSLFIQYFQAVFTDSAMHPHLHWRTIKSLYLGFENEDTRISTIVVSLMVCLVESPLPCCATKRIK